MNKKRCTIIGWAFVMALFVGSLSSCTDRAEEEESNTDYDEIEQLVFNQWIAANRADLLTSQQPEGYYIGEFDDSNATGDAVKMGEYIRYNITTCDLDGNICNTRNETMAVQQNTFNRYTRYVPMTDYILKESDWDQDDDDIILEAIQYAAMADEFIVNGETKSGGLRAGMTFTLYMTSAMGGTANGVGGYAGQYSHSGYRPLISRFEITDVINIQSTYEKGLIDEFTQLNSDMYDPVDDWVLLNDAEAHYIRLNSNYQPTDTKFFSYLDGDYQYEKMLRDNASKIGEPTTLTELNEMIYTELLDLYDVDESEKTIGSESTCYIRYILRTLDGFIVDTNISEVKYLIYGTISTSGALSYNAEDDEDTYISAWYHVIPKLKYGQWAAFLTTSTNAYGASGVSGSSSSTEIPPYTPLLMELFIVSVYDESYYYYYEDEE